MEKFCFVKFTENGSEKLIPSNLSIPTERVFNGITMAEAIMEKIDEGPVDIVAPGGKLIGHCTGYRIVGNKLKFIDEYFDSDFDNNPET